VAQFEDRRRGALEAYHEIELAPAATGAGTLAHSACFKAVNRKRPLWVMTRLIAAGSPNRRF
jgi:hypothetical protein